MTRVSAGSGAVANSSAPAAAAGTAPTAKMPTRRRSTSALLNHTRLPLLASCATVSTATASRVPRTATNTGSSSTPPPNPATADSMAVAKAAATITIPSSTVSMATHCSCRPQPGLHRGQTSPSLMGSEARPQRRHW